MLLFFLLTISDIKICKSQYVLSHDIGQYSLSISDTPPRYT